MLYSTPTLATLAKHGVIWRPNILYQSRHLGTFWFRGLDFSRLKAKMLSPHSQRLVPWKLKPKLAWKYSFKTCQIIYYSTALADPWKLPCSVYRRPWHRLTVVPAGDENFATWWHLRDEPWHLGYIRAQLFQPPPAKISHRGKLSRMPFWEKKARSE